MNFKRPFILKLTIDTGSFKKLFFSKTFIILMLVVLGSLLAFGVTVSLQDIKSGDPVSAAPIMANFNALKNSIESLIPVGTINPFYGTEDKITDGWVLCDGRSIDDAKYATLRSVINSNNAPDLRGMFLRGMQGTRSDGIGDPDATSRTGGNAIGSYQGDMLKTHNHYIGDLWKYAWNGGINRGGSGEAFDHSGVTSYDVGGNETRPKNIYVNYIIKY